MPFMNPTTRLKHGLLKYKYNCLGLRGASSLVGSDKGRPPYTWGRRLGPWKLEEESRSSSSRNEGDDKWTLYDLDGKRARGYHCITPYLALSFAIGKHTRLGIADEEEDEEED